MKIIPVLCAMLCSSLIYGESLQPGTTLADQIPIKVQIEKRPNALQGHYAKVSISLAPGYDSIGGFSFLIGYDSAALRLNQADPGEFMTRCGWKRLTTEYVPNIPGVSLHPLGLLRISAPAGGPAIHPSVGTISSNELVRLIFFVSDNRGLECSLFPIRFFWQTCDDNLIFIGYDDSAFYARRIYDSWSRWGNFANIPAEGLIPVGDTQPFLTRCRNRGIPDWRYAVDYVNGGIRIACAEGDNPMPGDIDLNGIPNQESDARALAGLLVHGCLYGYKTDSLRYMIRMTPKSCYDNTSVSAGNLVEMIRNIRGEMQLSLPPASDSASVTARISGDSLALAYRSSTRLGALLLAFDTDTGLTTPTTSDQGFGMQITYARHGGSLYLLIYDIEGGFLPEGDYSAGSIFLPALSRLRYAEAFDYDGRPVRIVTL